MVVSQEDIDELLETSANLAYAKDAAKLGNTPSLKNVDADAYGRHDGKASRRGSGDYRYSTDREENNDRRSRRSRDGDVDMEEGSDAGRSYGKSSGRRRSRSPARRLPSHEYGNYRERDRGRRGGGDYWDGSRHTHRQNDVYRPGDFSGDKGSPKRELFEHGHGRYRDQERGNHSDRRRDNDRMSYHDDNMDRDRRERGHGDRGPRRRRSRGHREDTPEPTNDERDRRTVFVQQLLNRVRSHGLRDFFERVGEVVDARIVKDRVTGRSKGVGYVEFKDEQSVEKAIQLTGQKLEGVPIIVQLTEAEKNRQVRNAEGAATQSNGVPFHRLYVGNIHFSITEDDLKNVFEPFGELEYVQLQKEEGGRSKGYGFVQFNDPTQAKEALEKMNGFELANRPIRVGLGNDKFTPESTQSLLHRFGNQAQQSQHQGSAFSGMGGRGAHAGGTGNFDRASGRDAEKTGGASALDDTDVAGVNFNNYSRDALMRKLARTDEPEQKIAPKKQGKLPAPNQPAPSRCVLLKNMYNQDTETEPDWQNVLKDDVRTECENKYGPVVHIGLALDNNEGEIYIKFENVNGGQNAIRGLNGRFFGGQVITAQYVVEAVYHMNFPKASSL